MPSPNDTPWGLLTTMAGSDPTRPRLTWYDDLPGPTAGERIELSGRVLATWAAKAANLLQEDLDAGPGSVVAVDLPTHWRAAYWLFAVWAVGAEPRVVPSASPPDVVVTTAPERWTAAAAPVVAVSLPALARQWTGDPLPPGTVDEARDLASYGDRFQPWATAPADGALMAPGARREPGRGPGPGRSGDDVGRSRRRGGRLVGGLVGRRVGGPGPPGR